MLGQRLLSGLRASPLQVPHHSVRVRSAAVNGASPDTAESSEPRYIINEIPKSAWVDGVPPVMGAHLMPSGEVAPISTSKGPGDGPAHVFQYHSEETEATVVQFVNFDGAAQGLAAQVAEASKAAIEAKGSFVLTVSGGSMVKALGYIAKRKDVDFTKWWVFFVDERNVPHNSDDSTFKGVQQTLLRTTSIPEDQVFAILEGVTAGQAATNYEGRMVAVSQAVLPRNEAGLPVFDAMLLGTGPDAHIASLFPNTAQLGVADSWVVPVTNSPKPPSERITMTLPVINAAKQCIFLATGSGKADTIERILECQALPGALPAQLVRPTNGTVTWILDVESSASLHIPEWGNKKAYPRSEI